jgi:hypothetical protein
MHSTWTKPQPDIRLLAWNSCKGSWWLTVKRQVSKVLCICKCSNVD